jgi:arginine:agmatine antiporter
MGGTVQKANAFQATLMVAGNIMGSGIFLVPVQLAALGSVTIWGWILSFIGVSCLALAFAKLSSVEDAGGGAYGFTRKAFGRLICCLVNATYFLSVIFGNCAGAIVGVGYLSLLWSSLDSWVLVVATMVVIWGVTLLNLVGPSAVLHVQGICTLLTCLPVFFVALFGWIRFDAAIFWESWNVSSASDAVAIQRGLNVQLWAFTGLETAAAVSSIVRHPKRDVPIATCMGVLIAAFGYILSCTVIAGMFRSSELSVMRAPFASAVQKIVGSDAGALAVGVCAVVGCVGSLAGWMLVASQTSSLAASDGLFPAVFASTEANASHRGTLLTSALMSGIVVACSLPEVGAHPFAVVSSLSSILTLCPYAITAAALRSRIGSDSALWNLVVIVSILYCLAALAGSQFNHILFAVGFVVVVVIGYFAKEGFGN